MKQKLMIALYSIKPIYSEKIISGEKTYELRKRSPAAKLDYIFIYSSSPVCKIVGYAEVRNIHKNNISATWDLVSKQAGISKKDYLDYFKASDVAYAFELGEVRRFLRPFDLKELLPNLIAPQSFSYIDQKEFNRVIRRKTELI